MTNQSTDTFPGDEGRALGVFGAFSIGIGGIVVGLSSGGLVLGRLGPSNWVPTVDIVASGMLVFLSYEGFELIANAPHRVQNPQRTLPYAYYGSILTALVIYVLIVIVTIGYLSFEALARARDYSLCAAAEGSWASWDSQCWRLAPSSRLRRQSMPISMVLHSFR